MLRNEFEISDTADWWNSVTGGIYSFTLVEYISLLLGNLSRGEVKIDELKVEAIANFPISTIKKDVMRFLGMAGYYHGFCRNFSTIAEPLTHHLKNTTTLAQVMIDIIRLTFTDIEAYFDAAQKRGLEELIEQSGVAKE
ncbi:hypothetical protein O3M35_000788 [Rhynocoris fuscipes]|uniref:Uncharacterized protein n=1 Tax=Rhynocoris fuscipes TaxID=488301 RepID=A0AAW1DNL5_9HEMI